MIKIIGGGLAGVEAAYQLLKRGVAVTLYEMRPNVMTPAHKTDRLAELVCSNSLKSDIVETASGLLKEEMRSIGSLTIEAAMNSQVPAGSALAVDKDLFSDYIEKKLMSYANLTIIREEITDIDVNEDIIIASGPLTSEKLAKKISELTGNENLHFYDAVAPTMTFESIDMNIAFFAARYNKGTDDYINCPMTKDEYDIFYNELIKAECVEVKDFDKGAVFEGCMPIEIMAKRGYDAIRFGPLRPVGILHPVTNNKYFAVVQLRKENKTGTIYNMVGFQTHLLFSEQKRVFSLIPGLSSSEFVRLGVMHRNTFINSPKVLDSSFRLKGTNVFFAGQITGVEGYVESAMSGMLAGINIYRKINNKSVLIPSEYTITGALSRHISTENNNFQPMNANFGILPGLCVRGKTERKKEYSIRALSSLKDYLKEIDNL